MENEIAQVLGPADPLESAVEFSPIERINSIFPNEQAFGNVDQVLAKLNSKILFVDSEIQSMLCSGQSDGEIDGGVEQLKLAQSTLQALYSEIQVIKEKARHAERTVQNITKDIKSLDCAKRNITQSVTVLRRLQMLVSAVDQLRRMVNKRQYEEVAGLFQAVNQLSVQFQTFRGVRQINELLESINGIRLDLKRIIFSDFENSFTNQCEFTGNASRLAETCAVIEIIDKDTKKQLLDWYCDLQLHEYRSIFRNSDEVGNFENIARRYAWFKRLIMAYDEQQAGIFPDQWNVSRLVCSRFCDVTKDDISIMLAKYGSGGAAAAMDVKLMIKSLQITLEFEAGLNRRFTAVIITSRENNVQEMPSVEDQQPNFSGRISSAFEPYMHFYIDNEEKLIGEIVDKAKQNLSISDEEYQTGVFASSADLFYFYRQSLANMAKMFSGKPLADISGVFRKWLQIYAELLTAKLPKDERKSAAGEEIKLSCLVLNTADYCYVTSSQLEEKIKEYLDLPFRSSIDLSKEKDSYLILITNSIQTLVRQLNSGLSNALQSMSRIPWSTMQHVGDQSEYVTTIGAALNGSVSLIRKLIRDQKHFKWFCDKFVDSFIPMFLKSIYTCKPISEIGAEQMLLDSHSLKKLLLDLPNMGAEERQTAPSSYVKFVTKGMARAETLLKVVLTPLEPAEVIIKNYMLLNSETVETIEKTTANAAAMSKLNEMRDGFIKILDLKGVKKSDQQQLIDQLMMRMGVSGSVPTAPSAANDGVSNPLKTPVMSNVSAAKNPVNDAGYKLNEGLKRFATGFDLKGASWLKGSSSTTKQQ